MRVPEYAVGSFSDLLEQRIDLIEEILLDKYRNEDEVVAEITELRGFYTAMVEQLEADAHAKGL